MVYDHVPTSSSRLFCGPIFRDFPAKIWWIWDAPKKTGLRRRIGCLSWSWDVLDMLDMQKNGLSSEYHGDLTNKNGALTMKHGDLCSKKMVIEPTQNWWCHRIFHGYTTEPGGYRGDHIPKWPSDVNLAMEMPCWFIFVKWNAHGSLRLKA
jgi:hypothetical protein